MDRLFPHRLVGGLAHLQGHEDARAARLDEGTNVGIDHELGLGNPGAAERQDHGLSEEQSERVNDGEGLTAHPPRAWALPDAPRERPGRWERPSRGRENRREPIHQQNDCSVLPRRLPRARASTRWRIEGLDRPDSYVPDADDGRPLSAGVYGRM